MKFENFTLQIVLWEFVMEVQKIKGERPPKRNLRTYMMLSELSMPHLGRNQIT